MTGTAPPPQPPDIGRRTLTPFGYAVCVAVPILVALVGLGILRLNYDKEDLVDGARLPILTSDWAPGDDGSDALLQGELTLGDDGCLLVGGETVVWPAGYAATVQRVGQADQLELYGPDRDVVARGGDTVALGGGYADAGQYAGRTCAPETGDVFLVQSEVQIVQGR